MIKRMRTRGEVMGFRRRGLGAGRSRHVLIGSYHDSNDVCYRACEGERSVLISRITGQEKNVWMIKFHTVVVGINIRQRDKD